MEKLRKCEEEIKEKDKAIEEKEKVIFQYDKEAAEISLHNLILLGLPELCKNSVNTTLKPSTNNNENFEFVLSNFQFFKEIDKSCFTEKKSKIISRIWFLEKKRDNNWRYAECNIQEFVKIVLQDVIEIAGLQKEIDLILEGNVANAFIPDVFVFKSNGHPIGVCEVKAPCRKGNDLDNPMQHIQIFNYMAQLMYMQGLRKVFGIVSTYNEWKIVWLENANNIASSDSIDYKDLKLVVENNISMNKIYGTETIDRTNPMLAKYLVNAIYKMKCCEVTPPKSFLVEDNAVVRKYPYLNDISYEWKTLGEIVLTYRETKKFYLLQDYKGGLDGRVWLGTSAKGNLAIIKFCKNGNNIKKECENWHKFGYTIKRVKIRS
jgi:hypothetical protein